MIQMAFINMIRHWIHLNVSLYFLEAIKIKQGTLVSKSVKSLCTYKSILTNK